MDQNNVGTATETASESANTPEAQIKDTDILFDCPYCSKSLAIDYHGAGLTIECTDCGNTVVVPIPNGMELSDLDSSPEEQDIRIMNLRKLLAQAEERIDALEAELTELSQRRSALEQQNVDQRTRTAQAMERLTVIRRAQADTYRAVDAISDLLKPDA